MCPEAFKCHVLLLSEDSKATLQNAMLQSMQQATGPVGGGDTSSSMQANESSKPLVMRIDMTKYKK